MEPSQEEAGLIPNYSKKKLRAHIDCSNGINDTTLLAACLNALGQTSKLEESDPDIILQNHFLRIFGEKSESGFVPTRKTTVIPKQSKSLCIGVIPQSEITLENTLEVFYREVSISRKNTLKGNDVSPWVKHMTILVCAEFTNAFGYLQEQEVRRKATSTSDRDLDEAYSYLFNIVATLFCLDVIGVREVTCSPLPMIFSSCTKFSDGDTISVFQQGMEIDPFKTVYFEDTTPSASILSTMIGIALLKVLTGTSTPQKSRIAPMVVQNHGFGIDDSNENFKVSIVIGTNKKYETDRKSTSEEPDAVRHDNKSAINENSLFHSDHVAHLETNLDDISGESLAFAIELLLSHGAIDAWVTPIVMKKGRPAHTLHCLCKDNDLEKDSHTLDKLLRLIFQHTSTLGVRIYRSIPRKKLDRTIVTVTTPFENTSREGKVDVKVSSFKTGEVVRKKAEFDHCKEIAIETGVGVQEVARQAIKKYDEIQMNES